MAYPLETRTAAEAAIVEPAKAKVNLDLMVLGRRPDGYHELDSLVVFTDLADNLALAAANDLSLELDGPFADGVPSGGDNLVLRAAEALRAATDVRQGARISLTKQIPPAAGLGGGSADAAAALRGLRRLWRVDMPDEELRDLAVRLGADVPVCVWSRPARMRGLGERLDPVRGLPDLPLLLVNPRVPVPTGEVFRASSWADPSAQRPPIPVQAGAIRLAVWLAELRNDLEVPAKGIAPVIGATLQMLRSLPGCLVARMSGSGATCFGLFADRGEVEAAAALVRRHQPSWWVSRTIARGTW